MTQEELKLVLDALLHAYHEDEAHPRTLEAITAIKEALAQPEPPQAGIMAAAMGVDNDIKAIMGVFDPAQLGQGNISGKALNGQQQQVDLTNFDYYDNLTRSIAHVGKILGSVLLHFLIKVLLCLTMKAITNT